MLWMINEEHEKKMQNIRKILNFPLNVVPFFMVEFVEVNVSISLFNIFT